MLGEYLQGTEPQEVRRIVGRGSAKRLHRYRRMAVPPLRDGADALRVTQLEVRITRPGGRVTCQLHKKIELSAHFPYRI